jgi:HAD superfamily hydrolase (TIGR01509 family)
VSLEALVFDFDGLIIDTEIVLYESTDATFRAHGTTLSFELWQSFIGRTDHPHWADLLEAEVGPIDRDAVIAERQGRYLAAVEQLPVLDGVLELIDEAAAAGLPMAVASSSSQGWVAGHLERIGLLERFAAVCTGDQVPRGKPWPDVYLLALERLGRPAAAAVAVEDSPVGCRAAAAAGMVPVAVPSAMTRGLDFPDAHHVATSATELDLAGLATLVAGRADRAATWGPGRRDS